MSLLDIIRNGVKLANTVTAPLQAKVQHYKLTHAADGYTTPSYGSPVSRLAIVDYRSRQLSSPSGQTVVSLATVTFLDPTITIGPDDKLVLPDGTTGPIFDISGFLDAGTGKPALTTVILARDR